MRVGGERENDDKTKEVMKNKGERKEKDKEPSEAQEGKKK
jgi:hypothetical protein